MVALVSCHDDVHVETLGTMRAGESAQMERDTIFRIASITKPIAAVSVMMTFKWIASLRVDPAVICSARP